MKKKMGGGGLQPRCGHAEKEGARAPTGVVPRQRKQRNEWRERTDLWAMATVQGGAEADSEPGW
jgi:hypothetical protein